MSVLKKFKFSSAHFVQKLFETSKIKTKTKIQCKRKLYCIWNSSGDCTRGVNSEQFKTWRVWHLQNVTTQTEGDVEMNIGLIYFKPHDLHVFNQLVNLSRISVHVFILLLLKKV